MCVCVCVCVDIIIKAYIQICRVNEEILLLQNIELSFFQDRTFFISRIHWEFSRRSHVPLRTSVCVYVSHIYI